MPRPQKTPTPEDLPCSAAPPLPIQPLQKPLCQPDPDFILLAGILEAVVEVWIVVDLDHCDRIAGLLDVDAVKAAIKRGILAARAEVTVRSVTRDNAPLRNLTSSSELTPEEAAQRVETTPPKPGFDNDRQARRSGPSRQSCH